MKAAVLHAVGKLVVEQVDKPKLRDGQVLVRVGAAGQEAVAAEMRSLILDYFEIGGSADKLA